MNTIEAFVADILANPSAEEPTRLILADWLEEHQDNRSASLRETGFWSRAIFSKALLWNWTEGGRMYEVYFPLQRGTKFPRCFCGHCHSASMTQRRPGDIIVDGNWLCFPCALKFDGMTREQKKRAYSPWGNNS